MRPSLRVVSVIALAVMAACGPPSVNVEQERNRLMAADREWSQTTKEPDRFLSYFAADASVYPPGMPLATGTDAIRKMLGEMSAMPGFALTWTAREADVGSGGELGYTAGTYEMTMGGQTERGKYVTIWKKQAGGDWKVVEDIFNADSAPHAPAATHVMVAPNAAKWGDPPPGLPARARFAVISGDPTQPGPFAVRLQMPAGYQIAPHWHSTAEHVTVLSGTLSIGMGETVDAKAIQDLPAGGYVVIPAETRHYARARSAATIQIQGMGPFVISYVNAADDPSKQTR